MGNKSWIKNDYKKINNSQKASNEAINGSNDFFINALKRRNIDYEYAKGNYFEYIEAMKFNTKAASNGNKNRAFVTENEGNPHAPEDIIIRGPNGGIKEKVQAKFVKGNSQNGYGDAAKTVFDQAGGQKGHWGKYKGMQRLIRKDNQYKDGESLLDESKKLANARANSNSIHSDDYADVYNHLTDELNDGNTFSGGTTNEEVLEAYNHPNEYINKFKKSVFKQEKITTTKVMAKNYAYTAGIVSGVNHFFEVLNNDEELDEAVKNICKDTTKAAIYGGTTGFVSSNIRIAAQQAGIPIINNSLGSVVLAGAMLDTGYGLYSYVKGDITLNEFKDSLVDTSIKSVSTVYYTQALALTLGAINPFATMAIYTLCNFTIANARQISKNCQLRAQEYDRLTSILEESTILMEQSRTEMNKVMDEFRGSQKKIMYDLLNSIEGGVNDESNYSSALNGLMRFADQTCIELQHTDFDDFKQAMSSKKTFKLG